MFLRRCSRHVFGTFIDRHQCYCYCFSFLLIIINYETIKAISLQFGPVIIQATPSTIPEHQEILPELPSLAPCLLPKVAIF